MMSAWCRILSFHGGFLVVSHGTTVQSLEWNGGKWWKMVVQWDLMGVESEFNGDLRRNQRF